MKKISFVLFITISLFMIINIATSQFNTSYRIGDSFGWPFIYFTAKNNFEFIEDTAFKMQFFIIDLMICTVLGIILSSIFILLKRIGK